MAFLKNSPFGGAWRFTNTSCFPVPLSPTDVDVLVNQTTENSVTLQWLYDPSTTHVENWIVSFLDTTGSSISKTVPRPGSGSPVETVVDGLEAGYKYSFGVESQVLGVFSEKITSEAFTGSYSLFDLSPFLVTAAVA